MLTFGSYMINVNMALCSLAGNIEGLEWRKILMNETNPKWRHEEIK